MTTNPSLRNRIFMNASVYWNRNVICVTVASLLLSSVVAGCSRAPAAGPAPSAALSVKITHAAQRDIAATIDTSGPLFAWQEVSIGSEVTGYRIQEVLVDVGDSVKKGQSLARLDSSVLEADRDHAAAALAEAEAMVKEAKANSDRAVALLKRGAISAQDADQQMTASATTIARAASAKAELTTAEQRVKYANVTAPDDGVISARSVAPGQIAGITGDLFKLIRKHRIEWRAEIPEGQFGKVRRGMTAQVKRADGSIAHGRVRALSPTLDPTTHRGIAYVDLTLEPALSPGMYVTGSIELGTESALTLPLDAVSVRDGFSYVFVLGAKDVVTQRRVSVGRVLSDGVEIREGVASSEEVVAAGTGFLRDGDRVFVVAAKEAAS